MTIDKLKDTIQDANINFLIGSGMSVPYFSTLANIEVLLSELNTNTKLGQQEKEIVRTSILCKYFENVISKNPGIVDDSNTDANRLAVLGNYTDFLVTLNSIVLKRKSTILNKQVNLFTTNIDVFFEKSLELAQLEFNDGFYGRFNPIFSLTNFKKSLFKKSLHYDNTSEIPVFNLLKVHGSLTWRSSEQKIFYSELAEIEDVKKKWAAIKSNVIDFTPNNDLKHFIKQVAGKTFDSTFQEFLDCYNKFAIVNPTKEKFHDTILNLHYYELLRMLSNELEKENSILFIMGFSLADEHIREIVLRAANSNPTLSIKIFTYNAAAKKNIEENIKLGNTILRYNNIEYWEPDAGESYDFKTINEKVFKRILESID